MRRTGAGFHLTLAGSSEIVMRGAVLLFAYSLGLAAPFLMAALGIETVQQRLQAMKRHTRRIEIVGGIILVLLGILMCSGAKWL